MQIYLKRKTYLIYILLIIIACFSLIFTNFSYDAEYQLAMAYRLLKGDTLISQMWEPHQTSAFLCAIIMKIYLLVTGTTTGIVLFTQTIGFLIRAGISLYLFKTIKCLTGYLPALIAGIMYLIISPKDLLVPEFSNMQLWFGTLMFLTLIDYFRCKKIWQLALSAICLCLAVFSYPSFIISYIAIFFILLRYSDNAKKDILVFTGICSLIGGFFVAYLLLTVGTETILDCLPRALAVEPSHTGNILQKLMSHLLNSTKVLGLLVVVGLIGFAIEKMIFFIQQRQKQKALSFSKDRWLFFSWYCLLVLVLTNILNVKNTGAISFPLLLILGLGFLKRNLLSEEEKKFYYPALWIGIMNLLATLLLSDHPILFAIPYMHTAICVSTIPLYHWFQEYASRNILKKLFVFAVHAFLLLIIFRSLYIHVPIYGRSQICSILSDMAFIRSGPALGLFTDEEGAARQRDSLKEWKEYIQPGDTIWIIGEPVDTLGYLYEDVFIGAPTVMSTPTYNNELLYYWEINPDKYPDVIILSSAFGELSWSLRTNEWLMNWLETEYQADTIINGNYWTYYFK